MIYRYFIGVCAAAAVLTTGCRDDVPALRAPAQVKLDSVTRQGSFTVDANMAWTATFDDPAQDWCSVDPATGGGFKSTKVTVTAKENPDTVRRTTLTITAGGASAKVTIIQGLGFVAYFSKPPKGTFTVNEVDAGTYFPAFNNIKLETPVPADTDRHILLSVSSPDGQKGVLYDYASPPQVTIRARETSATFAVQGIYAGFGTRDTTTVNVSIVGGSFPPVSFNQTYTLTMVKGAALPPVTPP